MTRSVSILAASGALIFTAATSHCGAEKAEARDDLIPLMSAAPDGVGPMFLPSLYNQILGSARVDDSDHHGLFVVAAMKTGGTLRLFRWLKNAPDGTPVFSPPQTVKAPGYKNGTVFQTADSVIHGLWLEGRSLIHATFRDGAFAEDSRLAIPELPGSPHAVAASPSRNEKLDLALAIQEKSETDEDLETNRSSEAWRPYNAAGISNLPTPHSYLFGLQLPSILTGSPLNPHMISSTRSDIGFRVTQITPVRLDKEGGPGLVAGTRMGIFYYYPDPFGLDHSPKRLVSGRDGIALRHPSISPSVAAYPGSLGLSDLIAAGEGGFYLYRFLNSFTKGGGPVYADPVPVLQEHAYLFAGKLPTLSVADWDGDGALDIIAGNSEGFVLFFKNVGSNDCPAFLPGIRIQAGGKDIHIQAGYSGSIQGLMEARWGYASPNVVDWNEDGLPDIVMGDITGDYTVFINRGTTTAPVLDPAKPIYCDGVNLHGMWRSRPAVAKLGDRMALIIVDGEDAFHLYWKIDEENVEDGGQLTLIDGRPIFASYDPAGGTGRCKLDLFDYDGDGVLDLIIGTGRRSAIPDKESGYPLPVFGKRTQGTPLFMKNTGSNTNPVFAKPVPFKHRTAGLVQPGGAHETGVIATHLGGNGPNLLVASETGCLYLLRGQNLSLLPKEEEASYRDRPNPLPPP